MPLPKARSRMPGPVDAGSWEMHQKLYGADYDYANFAPQFRAELFDPSHWADVFARSGAKYVALTSKHHEGFALWPSKEASKTWGRPWNSVEQGPHRELRYALTVSLYLRWASKYMNLVSSPFLKSSW